jgi:hypothetical protein
MKPKDQIRQEFERAIAEVPALRDSPLGTMTINGEFGVLADEIEGGN